MRHPTRAAGAYGLVVIAVAFGSWRTQVALDDFCRLDRARWVVNTVQNQVLTEPSVVSSGVVAALTHGDAGAAILVAQIKAANVRKAAQRERLTSELGAKPSC